MAQLPEGLARHVRFEVAEGRFGMVRVGAEPQPGDELLDGVVLPGFANAHSHAFHRALRGRTQAGRSTFWTWREQMYAVAARARYECPFAVIVTTPDLATARWAARPQEKAGCGR